MVKPGYKQTEIGVIPQDWEDRKLGEVGNVCMCKRIFAEQTSGTGEIPFFKIGTFGKDADAYISKELYEDYKRRFSYPQKGDVLISAAGTLGRSVVFNGKDAYFQDSNIVWLDIDKEQLCNEYLYHYYKVIKWASSEGSTIARLYNGIICNTHIALPNREEQNLIATVLSELDELIALTEKQISKKKAIKQGAMQELLTGKHRLPGFSEEWITYHLEDLGVFLKGSGINRAESNSGNIPAVRYGELYTTHHNYVTQFVSHISKEVAAKAKQVYKGDILFAASGETKEEIGKCAAIIGEQIIFAGGDILIFRPHKQQNPIFMGTLLNTAEVCRQRAEKGQGDAVVHIHADSLGSIKIRIPETNEQDAIAEILLGMDQEIEMLEKKLEKYRQVKQGMMQQLLTGKVRLK